ncbi:hypothetical protein [Streptomyces sp. NPDC102360]|uniref:hypothetical protein n=1 Tax=Streptomyces sp. NPDC102360 TaxID=3366160 RepID=UPI00381C7086
MGAEAPAPGESARLLGEEGLAGGMLGHRGADEVVGAADRLPAPEGLASCPLTSVWPGGYIASILTVHRQASREL